jgi:hypothetical protein
MRPTVFTAFVAILLLCAATGSALAACFDAPGGLVSWWTADGTPNDIQDRNNGTLHGGMGFGIGKVILAFELDGIDDYVDAGNDASVRPDFPFSVDFWINMASATDSYGMASTDIGGNGLYSGFRVYVNTEGAVVTGIGNNQDCCSSLYRRNFISPAGVVTIGAWHHVAVVFETATSHLIYVDGVLQPTTMSGDATTMVYAPGNVLQFGRVFDPNLGMFVYGHGLLDEIELHTGILDPADIWGIFAADSDGKCRDSPVASETETWGTIKATFSGR